MRKKAYAFRSIGEVARLIGVAPHVLRYWETQFSQLRPMKRPDGRRYYRPEDVLLAAGLCEVLRDDGLTIRGAKKMLARDRGDSFRERGAARLGDLMGSELSDLAGDPAYPLHDETETDDAPLTDEEAEVTDHTPRSRHRRRRSPAQDHAPLPLFPDLDSPSGDESWAARMARLTAALRRTRHVPSAARTRAMRLRDLIAQIS
ncbi:MerR family transcriptional regulator [Paracoccus sp. (in: a-proteobacteria)]|uniref:MerR family transcriptional regulator n=1 Tax=Paracoccus sp. TaxID=267 RepID=UPI003A88F7E3